MEVLIQNFRNFFEKRSDFVKKDQKGAAESGSQWIITDRNKYLAGRAGCGGNR
ncbi:conserved protein of unknown function [Lactobacillus delbrueckii subsp. delbrueckii]|uniref:Uncharacterized protein n=1 Tax=Lactobacillus delbrueckii subsp. delbrueckii TaxID=83684 RepID=A0AAU9QZU5_9LACO|nr:conserved protein of unknown function [Lactobacillus delbrueckii subsp. delbrueckii]